jgi:hypothetical protein
MFEHMSLKVGNRAQVQARDPGFTVCISVFDDA